MGFDGVSEDGLELGEDGGVQGGLGGDAAGVVAVKPEEAGDGDGLEEGGEELAGVAVEDVDVGGLAEAAAGEDGELRAELYGVEIAEAVLEGVHGAAKEGSGLDEGFEVEGGGKVGEGGALDEVWGRDGTAFGLPVGDGLLVVG